MCGCNVHGYGECTNDGASRHMQRAYLTLMQGGSVSDSCCGGVRNILGSASTTSDKQTVCKCLQQAANNYGITKI
ncbi:hypothetical protein JHK87_050885 [Glycine soja]|nr:hypothetical protein JHK87_050885 [Glycine soja]